MKKILLASDLHICINSNFIRHFEDFGFIKKLPDADVLCIAGDISGSYKDTYTFLNFLRNYIQENELKTKVIAIAGNHDSYASKQEHMTRTQIITKLRNDFSKGEVIFCENDFVDIGNNTLVYGCCLYTDFWNSMYNERMAEKCINDFRYSYEYDIYDDRTRPVNTEDYIKWYHTSVNKIDDFCTKNKDKNIILLTHFGMSLKSISPEYTGNYLNSFYTSDLEWLFKKHKNIKYSLQGHTHAKLDYKIDECRVVCSPLGYILYNNNAPLKPEYYEGKFIEI